jgi:hypothetical protein
MDSGKLLSRHALDNGLTLEHWDRSRPVAGDRWHVVLEASISISVTAATLPPELRPKARVSRVN